MTTNVGEEGYLDLLDEILNTGVDKGDRTGTGTRSIFGTQLKFRDLYKKFPLVTTKKIYLNSVIGELLWFLSGNTNACDLEEIYGTKIWSEWGAKEDDPSNGIRKGDLGPVYGKMWTEWPGTNGPINQIENAIQRLKTNPNCRRIIVSGWNPDVLSEDGVLPCDQAALGKQALPPCHVLFQFYTQPLTLEQRMDYAAETMFTATKHEDLPFPRAMDSELEKILNALNVPTHGLSCHLYQRSADVLLGVPFNIASYSLLTMMIGQQVNMAPLEFTWSAGDVHIYKNHFDQVKEQLSRTIRPAPKMEILSYPEDITGYTPDSFKLVGYNPHDPIKAPIAV